LIIRFQIVSIAQIFFLGETTSSPIFLKAA